jgi:hypothetical protein
MGTARIKPKKVSVEDALDRAIASFGTKRNINGGLRVNGHDYWWILEYGSSPASPGIDLTGDDLLQPPDDLPAPHFHTEEYPIRPVPRINPETGKLRWLYYWHRGSYRFRLGTEHPGVAARGFVRKAVRKAQLQLKKDLDDLRKRTRGIPTRDQIVAVVNNNLRLLLQLVKASTPVGSPIEDHSPRVRESERNDGTHLKDAWYIEPAE